MKSKLIPYLLIFIAGVAVGALFFSSGGHEHGTNQENSSLNSTKVTTTWTCSMHPQIQEDKPGKCPLCGMDLIPVKKEDTSAQKVWTCSMHPQIKQDKPGKCPICGMDLIPIKSDTGSNSDREVKLSKYAMKLAEIESVKVIRKKVQKEIRVVGKLGFDETLQKTITAWIPGRLDRLFVDYTGISVKKNDHLVSIYSPELLASQEELIQTYQALQNTKGLSKESMQQTLNSIREKLRLWGLNENQIQHVINTGRASDHMIIYSPLEGVVIHKMIKEGMYVKAGTPLYMIADLTRLWLKLDVYEADLPWVHYGQKVEFETESWPGEVFKGKIIFIDPVVDKKTRTIKVRVEVSNLTNKLKPEMFVRSIIQATLQSSGKSMSPELKGKWISPMHPEIVKDQAGNCDICGMDLVRAETLYKVSDMKEEIPLVIPASAPLITGKRAVVYLDMGNGRFVGKTIRLGSRAGDSFIVKSGLNEGDKVVTRGNFKLDSAVQIKAGISMMNPEPSSNKHQGSHRHESNSTPVKKTMKAKGITNETHKQKDSQTNNKQGSRHNGSHKH